MKIHSIVTIAGLCLAGVLFADDKPAANPETQPAMAPAPSPNAMPVPNLPIIETKTLEGGLIIEDMKIGDGPEVKPGDTVTAFYHGTLKESGKKFDSAFERGEAATFPLARVIPGWQQGIPGMKPGGIRRLTIPAALGYGAAGAGADIPPNSDLVFVVQLAPEVKKKDITLGTGAEVTGQVFAVARYVIKDESGKEIERSGDAPAIWLPGEMPVAQGLEGMKVGGKREISIPKEINSAPQGMPPVKCRVYGVPITIEVELLAIRPWPPADGVMNSPGGGC